MRIAYDKSEHLLPVTDDEFEKIVAENTTVVMIGKCVSKPNKYGEVCQRVKRLIKRKILHMKLNTTHFTNRVKRPEVKDNVLCKIVGESSTETEILKKCKWYDSTVNRREIRCRIERLSISTEHLELHPPRPRKTKLDLVDNETFRTVWMSSTTINIVSQKCGYSKGLGPNSAGVKMRFIKRAESLGMDTSHFKKQRTIEQIFAIQETHSACLTSSCMKIKLIQELHLPYVCKWCNNTHFQERDGVLYWFGKPTFLDLDHINGNTLDNRLENLRFLCKICHAQTNTHSSKNKMKVRFGNEWAEGSAIRGESSSP